MVITVLRSFLSQPILLGLEAPFKIHSDIHGQSYMICCDFLSTVVSLQKQLPVSWGLCEEGKAVIGHFCLLPAYKTKYLLIVLFSEETTNVTVSVEFRDFIMNQKKIYR